MVLSGDFLLKFSDDLIVYVCSKINKYMLQVFFKFKVYKLIRLLVLLTKQKEESERSCLMYEIKFTD